MGSMSKPNFRIIEQEAGAVDYSDYEEFKHKYLNELDKDIVVLYREVRISSNLGLKYIRRIKAEEGVKRYNNGAGVEIVPIGGGADGG